MAITNVSGDAQRLIGEFFPPTQLNGPGSGRSPNFQVFDERQGVLLSRDIKIAQQNPLYVENNQPANFDPPNLTDSDLAFDWDVSYDYLPTLSAGTLVNSHLIAVIVPSDRAYQSAAVITFDSTIIGLIDSRDSDKTNDLFSFTSYTNPNGQTLEGLNWPQASTRDYVKITGENNNILELRWNTFPSGYESLRVLTLASGSPPPPSVQTFTGDANANLLQGTVNADILVGLGGNDTYTVNNINDEVIEELNEGTDTVKSSVTYTLTTNVEKLTLLGTTNLNGTGNELNNTLTGNAGNNILSGLEGNDIIDGKAGADTMQGGVGNDTYTVDNIGDIVTEDFNAGIDTVKSSISYTLDVNVENLTLLGSANLDGTGNALGNSIRGNSGDNILDGGAGKDFLFGGAGADVFRFQFGHSTGSSNDRILDFEIGIDKIDLLTQGGVVMDNPTAFSRAADATVWNITQMVNTVFADVNGALDGNQAMGLNSAVLVQGKGAPYLIVNDGVAGFQSENDLVINLQGFKGILPDFGAIAVEQFFI